MQGIRTLRHFWVHLSSQRRQAERRMPQELRICIAHHAHGTRNHRGSCRGRGSDLVGQMDLHVPHLPDRGSFSCGTRSSPDLEPTPGTPGRSSRCSSAGAWPQPCGGPQACPSGWRAGHCPEQSHWGLAAQQALEGQGGLKTSLLRTGGWTAHPHCGAHHGCSGDRGSDY